MIPPLWNHLSLAWRQKGLNDFNIQCGDGIVSMPKLFLAAISAETALFHALLQDDCFLVLPEVETRQVEALFEAVLNRDNEVLEETKDVFSWIDWSKWRKSDELVNSKDVVEGVLNSLVDSLPLKEKPKIKKRILPSTSLTEFKCAICGKKLANKKSLRKHEDVVHFNIRPFECQMCFKRFADKSDSRVEGRKRRKCSFSLRRCGRRTLRDRASRFCPRIV